MFSGSPRESVRAGAFHSFAYRSRPSNRLRPTASGRDIPGIFHARVATAGLIKRDVVTSTSRRPRHCYRITAAGRKLARTGWIDRLKDPAPNDLEAVLRLLDMATHYRADVDDIAGFLKSSARDRTSGLSAKPSRSKPGDTSGAYLSTLRAWTSTRLQTESRFLAALADSWLQTKRPSGKVRSS